MVALLPVPPTCSGDKLAEIRDYQSVKSENLHSILRQLLQHGASPRYRGMEMRCADGNTRMCFLRPCGWVADYLEYTKLYNLENKGCPVCEVRPTDLGKFWCPPPKEEWETDEYGNSIPRSGASIRTIQTFEEYEHNAYLLRQRTAQLSSTPQIGTRSREDRAALQAEIRSLKDYFKERKQKPVVSALWSIDCRVPIADYQTAVSGFDLSMGFEGTLWKPDLLHSMYQGMLKHLMEWLEGFLARHNKLKAFDRVWRRIPSYPGLVTPSKGYR